MDEPTSRSRTAVVIPTLGRPHRIHRLLENVAATTHSPCRVYFVVEGDDTATVERARRHGADVLVNEGPATYASCIDSAYRRTVEPFLFLGADDIVFQDGWLEAAIAAMADPRVGVVGTADPVWPLPDHSSHSLVRRRYIDEQGGSMDRRGRVLHPYRHGFTDHELVGVAKARRAYAYCEASRVEHHHPGWDSAGRVRRDVALDATYRKGNRHHWRDMATFVRRSADWMYLIQQPSRIDRDMRRYVSRYRGVLGYVRYRGTMLLPTLRDALRGPRLRPPADRSTT